MKKAILENKTVSFAILLLVLVFTVGLPTNVISGDWQLYSVWDVTPKWFRLIIVVRWAVSLFGLVAHMIEQSHNDSGKGGGYG